MRETNVEPIIDSMIFSYHGVRLLLLMLLAELGLSGQRRALEVALLLYPAHAPARNVFPLSVAEVGGDRAELAVVVVVWLRLRPRVVVVRQVRVVVVCRGSHRSVCRSATFRSLLISNLCYL